LLQQLLIKLKKGPGGAGTLLICNYFISAVITKESRPLRRKRSKRKNKSKKGWNGV